MDGTQETKRCPACGETRPRSDFYRAASARDGLQHQCKQCQNVSVRLAHARSRARGRIANGDEVAALGFIIEAMNSMTQEAHERVLAYLHARYLGPKESARRSSAGEGEAGRG